MTTLRLFLQQLDLVPAATAWYLADIAEARGRQELYTRQSPQRLKALREHALVESAVSSNRIEGVEIDQARVATVVFGKSGVRDRDEEEIRGYRQALTWIHEQREKLPITEDTILQMHRLIRGEIWDAGRYKDKERLIEQNKERYYETLEQSSQGWHDGNHDPWPYINYLFSILKAAYKEFEERLDQVKSPRGAKTDLVISAIKGFSAEFSLSDLERACPGVSRDMVRRVLRNLQSDGDVICLGRGPGALWRGRACRDVAGGEGGKKGNTPKRG